MKMKSALSRTSRRALVVLAALVAATACQAAGLDSLMPDYEAVRLQLVADSIDRLAEPAARLETQLEALEADLTDAAAGVPEARLSEIEALLPGAIVASRALAEAADLESAREAFYALSKPLVRWRQAVGEGPVVAYCPMKQRSWLQAEAAEIGNPYYGQAMPTCGSVLEG